MTEIEELRKRQEQAATIEEWLKLEKQIAAIWKDMADDERKIEDAIGTYTRRFVECWQKAVDEYVQRNGGKKK